MEGVLLLLLLTSLKWFAILINAEATNTTFPILNATDLKSFNKSSILRYGHHRTQKCSSFEKTYVCINSCLERGYDIASANEDCQCTCFKDKVKSKYTGSNKKNWKIPTTYRPSWAGSNPSKRPKGKFVFVTSHSTTYTIPEFLKNPVDDSDLFSELKANKSSKEDKSQEKSDKYSSKEKSESQEKSGKEKSKEKSDSQEESDKEKSKEKSDSQEESGKEKSKEKSDSHEESGKEKSDSQEESGKEKSDSQEESGKEKSDSQEESGKEKSKEKEESQEELDKEKSKDKSDSQEKSSNKTSKEDNDKFIGVSHVENSTEEINNSDITTSTLTNETQATTTVSLESEQNNDE